MRDILLAVEGCYADALVGLVYCLLITTRHKPHQTLVRVLRLLLQTRSRFNGHAVSPTRSLGLLALFTILHTVTLRDFETMKSRKMSHYRRSRHTCNVYRQIPHLRIPVNRPLCIHDSCLHQS